MTTLKLVGVTVLCGAFTGLRGGLFSLAMWRLNVRIRQELFRSLLAQEVGFYDTAQTGVFVPDAGWRGQHIFLMSWVGGSDSHLTLSCQPVSHTR